MNKLGIYFGPQGISIVESKLKKPINYIHIPQTVISPNEPLEEKVPEEIKIAPLIKNEFIKKGIESNTATIILSGKDLIVRTFEIPVLPQEELSTAVNFEAKKYIPFKIEELFSDSQWKLDRISKKNFVLFMGIKCEVLDRYVSILDQLGLKINSIEYSAFSMLRFLELVNIREKGIIAIIDIDLVQNEEANFVVLEQGFPLFSRDLTSISESNTDFQELTEETDHSSSSHSIMLLERLKREILVSWNYYERKFLGKNITKIFFVINPDYQPNLSEIFKDIGLPVKFIDINRLTRQFAPFSLSFIKAYSGSLQGVQTEIKTNLLAAKERKTREKGLTVRESVSFKQSIVPYLKVVFVCILICVMVFIFGVFQAMPLKRDLADAISIRLKFAQLNPEASIEELKILNSKYNEKKNIIDTLFAKQKYLTPLLDTIPRIIPNGLWLNSFIIHNDSKSGKIDISLVGTVYLGDSNKEREQVNNLLAKMKASPVFMEYFKEMGISSIDRSQIGNDSATNFSISCRN